MQYSWTATVLRVGLSAGVVLLAAGTIAVAVHDTGTASADTAGRLGVLGPTPRLSGPQGSLLIPGRPLDYFVTLSNRGAGRLSAIAMDATLVGGRTSLLRSAGWACARPWISAHLTCPSGARSVLSPGPLARVGSLVSGGMGGGRHVYLRIEVWLDPGTTVGTAGALSLRFVSEP